MRSALCGFPGLTRTLLFTVWPPASYPSYRRFKRAACLTRARRCSPGDLFACTLDSEANGHEGSGDPTAQTLPRLRACRNRPTATGLRRPKAGEFAMTHSAAASNSARAEGAKAVVFISNRKRLRVSDLTCSQGNAFAVPESSSHPAVKFCRPRSCRFRILRAFHALEDLGGKCKPVINRKLQCSLQELRWVCLGHETILTPTNPGQQRLPRLRHARRNGPARHRQGGQKLDNRAEAGHEKMFGRRRVGRLVRGYGNSSARSRPTRASRLGGRRPSRRPLLERGRAVGCFTPRPAAPPPPSHSPVACRPTGAHSRPVLGPALARWPIPAARSTGRR